MDHMQIIGTSLHADKDKQVVYYLFIFNSRQHYKQQQLPHGDKIQYLR